MAQHSLRYTAVQIVAHVPPEGSGCVSLSILNQVAGFVGRELLLRQDPFAVGPRLAVTFSRKLVANLPLLENKGFAVPGGAAKVKYFDKI
jgi:hypothetical protein